LQKRTAAAENYEHNFFETAKMVYSRLFFLKQFSKCLGLPGDKPCRSMESPLVAKVANDRIVMRGSDGVHFHLVS
jgi:hypothetical protein